MGGMLVGHHTASSAGQWLQLGLAAPVVLWGAWPFFVRANDSLRTGNLNMFTLVGLGIAAAFGYSAAAVLVPGLFPASAAAANGVIEVYFEAAAVITTLVLAGQILEQRAANDAGGAIRALVELAPPIAHRIDAGGAEFDIALAQVALGDRLQVRPGEKFPVDGILEQGSTVADESMVTGESLPLSKNPGDLLIGGTLNGNSAIIMQATRVGDQTLLSRIVHMVSEAQRSRAPIQRLADKVSGYFVPTVAAAAALTFAVWFLIGPAPALGHAVVNSVAVLIIACPCALGLATPVSIVVGTGRGAQMGILIKNAEALETLEKVDTIVVDKTGTLTEGKPKLVNIRLLGELSEDNVLGLAAGLERTSEHPYARAIVSAAMERGITPEPVTGFQSYTGMGVGGETGGRRLLAGSRRLVQAAVTSEESVQRPEYSATDGKTAVYLSIDSKPAAILEIADPIKPSAPAALEELRTAGIKIVMLTGDNAATAKAVGQALGISDIHAEVLPQDKHRIVKELQNSGRIVAMAGDGINDAPALAQAHVGIAMGHGTDVAMESAGVTLVKGDLRGILRAVKLSRATMSNIRQNLFFATIYNGLGIPVAAGVLYPALHLTLNPMIAAAAMSLSSISVIGNALRLRNA